MEQSFAFNDCSIMAATLRDIAQELNISTAIVSRVLNRKPGNWASSDTQERIFATAKALNYRPSKLARALVTGRTMQLAMASLSNPADRATQFLDAGGLVERAGEDNYRVMLLPLLAGESGERALEEFLSDRDCDGLCLFAPQVARGHLSLLKHYGVPCSILGSLDDTKLQAEALECAAIVDHDNYRVAFDSVEWLRAQGRRRIAWARGPGEAEQPHVRHLRRGYSDAMRAGGLEPLVLEHSEQPGVLRRFIASRQVDAVIVRYLHGALAWLLNANQAGVALPDELTVMVHLEARNLMDLRLCGMHQNLAVHLYDVRETGRRAADILLQWAGGEPPIKRTVLVPPHAPAWGTDS